MHAHPSRRENLFLPVLVKDILEGDTIMQICPSRLVSNHWESFRILKNHGTTLYFPTMRILGSRFEKYYYIFMSNIPHFSFSILCKYIVALVPMNFLELGLVFTFKILQIVCTLSFALSLVSVNSSLLLCDIDVVLGRLRIVFNNFYAYCLVIRTHSHFSFFQKLDFSSLRETCFDIMDHFLKSIFPCLMFIVEWISTLPWNLAPFNRDMLTNNHELGTTIGIQSLETHIVSFLNHMLVLRRTEYSNKS